ncbi:Acyl-CoA dehydrogenase [Arboricoccus pini]|uniref:Acyl-CoA dehydrogenase n=1 Tax=Arboricoccus pini TaxID=1963835 RepID=A0A212RKF0_9PROT|nr:acyl-CoA dehydrogenase family protein [Arboricoccus pini]SNB72943.1 Acyl-CoA dehydrogenase [Arboricoccus pini]
MTQIDRAWGGGPSVNYEALASRFRPLFARFREGAAKRDLERRLPDQEFADLKKAGFGALRVPKEYGGAGASLPELFALLIELSEGESNLTQAYRAHFGYVEDVINSADPSRRDRWLGRVGRGDVFGGAWSETGESAKLDAFSTRVTGQPGDLRLDGRKYYTTGSLFADWIDVGATNEAGEGISVVVSRHDPGVDIQDDWDGIGQTLTASGSATFHRVALDPADISKADLRFGYAPAFFQLFQLANIAGIGRALATDLARAVAARTRTYTHAAASRSSEDPQVLQVVGRVRGAAYASGAIVLQVAEALQRAADARQDATAFETAVHIAELESAQAQTVITDLVLHAATIAFDALGASAVKRDAGLDRHWRNVRTLASHNPRIYKDRIVGDYAVNGTAPPPQWRVGRPAE